MLANGGNWTAGGKKLIAQSMYEKGKAFLAAAILLRQRTAYEYAVLHLICQGIEVMAKGYLLLSDYDLHKPLLRKSYGHNLLKLVIAVEQASNIEILNAAVSAELDILNKFYKSHLLRYGSGYDILVNPVSIPSKKVLSRVAALLRLENKNLVKIAKLPLLAHDYRTQKTSASGA